MKNSAIAITLMLVCFAASAQTDAKRQQQYNLKRSIAIDGYDPVSYFTGNPKEGKSEHKLTHHGVTYLFANASNLETFKSNPDKYEPAYGGWCAYAMGETGEKVKVDPETYKILDGKLYLFYNFWGNNTLSDWNKSEKKLKEAGDKNWKKIIQ